MINLAPAAAVVPQPRAGTDVAALAEEVRAMRAELSGILGLIAEVRGLGYREGLAEAGARDARARFRVIAGGAA